MIEDLPPLPGPLEKDFQECLARVKATAQRLRESKFGRFTQTDAPVTAIDYGTMDRPSRPRKTDFVLLPLHKTALVIGHNGEGLKRIEKMAQVKIQLDTSYTMSDKRRLLITGYPDDIAEAKRIIEEGSLAGGQSSTTMLIPQARVGLIIGRGGETIRELQEKSGAKIMVAPDLSSSSLSTAASPNSSSAERIVSIMGDPDAIQRAKDMIDEVVFGIIRNKDESEQASSKAPLLVQVPEACVGGIIGKKAENLRAIQSISGAKVFIEPSAVPGTSIRNIHISGPPEAIAYAQQLLSEKISTIDSAYGGGYGYDVAGGGVVYQSPGEFGNASFQVSPVAYYDYSTFYNQMQYYHAAAVANQAQQDYFTSSAGGSGGGVGGPHQGKEK